MTLRELLNAYTGDYNFIRVLEYIGDFGIGADPEEDYEKISTFSDRRDIPVWINERKIEYFTIEAGTFTVWLMG